MKIAVVGAGAMGSLFGALLTEAGNDVWLYDVWPEHVHAVAEHGLSVEHEGRTKIVQIKATTEPKEIGQADLVIIFVKSTQTKPAAETARRLLCNDARFVHQHVGQWICGSKRRQAVEAENSRSGNPASRSDITRQFPAGVS